MCETAAAGALGQVMTQALSGAPVGILELMKGVCQSFQLAIQAVIEGCHHSA